MTVFWTHAVARQRYPQHLQLVSQGIQHHLGLLRVHAAAAARFRCLLVVLHWLNCIQNFKSGLLQPASGLLKSGTGAVSATPSTGLMPTKRYAYCTACVPTFTQAQAVRCCLSTPARATHMLLPKPCSCAYLCVLYSTCSSIATITTHCRTKLPARGHTKKSMSTPQQQAITTYPHH